MSGGISNARLGRKDVVKDDSYLGATKCFMDKDHADPDAVKPLSGRSIMAMYTKNSSGGALAPATGVVMKSGALNTIGGASGANTRCDGIIDPFLTANVADGEYCWIIIKGPVDVEIGSGNIAANAVVQSIAAGKFAGGTAGTNPVGHAGIAEEAANDGSRARILFNSPFGINN